jgi:hypothetical protein
MPETSMDKYHRTVFGKGKIRLSGKVLVMQSVPEPLAEKILPYN